MQPITATAAAAATGATALPGTTRTGPTGTTTPQPRLVKAAHEFEAQMMKELIKPLNQGNALTGTDDGDDDSGSSGALGEFASEALGRALSEGGGFGIASSIIKQLSPPGNQNGKLPVTGNLHRDTVIKNAE
jgi:Rod binding domain-containing protein